MTKKSTTGYGEKLKSELHHWWPRSLSQHWCDAHRAIHQMAVSGEIRRLKPKSLGAQTNAHHILVGGPWSNTFEPVFSEADSSMTSLVDWVLSLEANTMDTEADIFDRITPQTVNQSDLERLAKCAASLIARSPRTRNAIRIGARYYREQFGMINPEPEDHLIAANQRPLYESYLSTMRSRGRWAILYSDSTEFIFGDGFLHNFCTIVGPYHSGPCLIPLLPTVTILYDTPSSHRIPPRLVTMRLDEDEIRFMNDTVQIYSKQHIFYRSQKPNPHPGFLVAEHMEYKHSATDWLRWFSAQLCQFPARPRNQEDHYSMIPASMRGYFD